MLSTHLTRIFNGIFSPALTLAAAAAFAEAASPAPHESLVAALNRVVSSQESWDATLATTQDALVAQGYPHVTDLAAARSHAASARQAAVDGLAPDVTAAAFAYKVTQVKLQLTFVRTALSRTLIDLAQAGLDKSPAAATVLQLSSEIGGVAAQLTAATPSEPDPAPS